MKGKESNFYDVMIDRIDMSESAKTAAKAQIRKIECLWDFIESVSAYVGRGFRALRLTLQPEKPSREAQG